MGLNQTLSFLSLLLTATPTTATPQLPLAGGHPAPPLAATSSSSSTTTTTAFSSSSVATSIDVVGGTLFETRLSRFTTSTTLAPTASHLAPRSWHPFTWPSNWPFIPEETGDGNSDSDSHAAAAMALAKAAERPVGASSRRDAAELIVKEKKEKEEEAMSVHDDDEHDNQHSMRSDRLEEDDDTVLAETR